MDQEQIRQVEQIFFAAIDLDPSARDAFLERACAGDTSLRGEVEALLGASARSADYFDKLPDRLGIANLLGGGDGHAGTARTVGEAGQQFGQYTLTEPVGSGGMGTVWRAERSDGRFEGEVAVKLLAQSAGGAAPERFALEGRYLARLTHPNIARLLDAGVGPGQQPYLVLEYVPGSPIDRYCDDRALSVDGRTHLFLQVLDAVTHAHAHLIVHRDIKPSNVQVTPEGSVKLLDFGVAKLLGDEALQGGAALTRQLGAALTPEYAAPEQLNGETITTATDVYSLGLLLWFLLTGVNPRETTKLESLAELRALAQKEPTRLFDAVTGSPSEEQLSKLARERNTSSSDFLKALRSDLDNIVRKALAVDPEERYETVADFAQDLRRYLHHEPVTAQAPTIRYRAQKFVRRHRGGVLAASLTLLALVSAAAITTWQSVQVAHERDRAERTRDFLISIFDAADPNVVPGNQTAREILEAGRKRIGRELADHPAVRADLLQAIGSVYRSWRLAPEGREVLEQELGLRATMNGRDSAEYGAVLIELAVMADIAGDYQASLDYASEALQIGKRSGDRLGEAAGHERVGRILHLQGDYDGAGAHFRDALAILIGELGAEAIEVTYIREHLANLLDHQQRDEESLAEFRQSVEVRKRHVDGDSSEISSLYLGIGSVLIDLDRLEEAQAAYLTGYEMNDRLYGPGNSYNSYFANGLGKVAEALGDLEAAASRYTEAVELVLKHTPESPNLAFVNASLGKVYRLQDRCDQAISYYRAADEIFTARLPAHWARGDVKAGFGACLAKRGDFAEAESLILSGIEIVERQWGPEHEITTMARSAAASLYDAWEKPEKAALFR